MELSKFFKSFHYAFNGFIYCLKAERNFRFHLTFMTYMFSILVFGNWFVLSRTDWALLVLACSSVISSEIMNTAVENAVNHSSTEKSTYARISKDTAAAAVLCSTIFAIVIGFILLFQVDAFRLMFGYFLDNPLMLALLVLSLIPAILFIFMGNPFKRK